MEKRFDYKKREEELYKSWKDSGYFSPEKLVKDGIANEDSDTFSMVLPPPNVTGTLHMGHAEMLVIQDVLTRYHRMRGKRTLWIPGTDHAAIATQTKVEKELIKEENKTRHDLGRDKFLEKVDKFAQESHDTIVHQIERMGASLDWTREAFTLDDQRETAVYTAFKNMYDSGLIYRGDRVINWCPRCSSTLSDDEVERKERTTTLYEFKYDKDFPITIATTRPETKLGDTAVAVHPDDDRYDKYVGKELNANFAGKSLKIKVVADNAIDPEFGTGAVGVTPAHSHADSDIAERHNLESIQVIGEDGKMKAEAGDDFKGLSVAEAREKAVEWLQENKLIENEERVPQNLSVCYRCDTPVEPLPKLQWFIDVNKKFEIGNSRLEGVENGSEVTLKELMKTVVENGQIEIIPERFKKVYFHWIENLRDWCISRQIWYGHQIPVWHHEPKCVPKPGREDEVDKCKEIVVSGEKPECKFCDAEYTRDPDTLDTWFSSGLWTFSTLGWPSSAKATEGRPEEGSDLDLYHPTSVLETGYDILFFWVARMILMSTFHMGEVPFETVYLHGMVRDDKGRKMSKSLENVIDPLDMIEQYGADATRLSLIIGVGPGNDVNISEDKVRAYRNFATKIWNASRFVNMNKPEELDRESVYESFTEEDNAVLDELKQKRDEIAEHIEKFELNLAGEKAYDFFWNRFANEILEKYKDPMYGDSEADQKRAYLLLENVLFGALKILHPFVPYVTEEIYGRLEMGDENREFLMVEDW